MAEMRVTTSDFYEPCGCRAVGECSHNSMAEFKALDSLVDQFAEAMKKKLRRAICEKGRSGWDDPSFTVERIRGGLRHHVEKGDPVDVAN